MKNKKYLWLAGWLCAIPLSLAAQQTEPLTGKERLFNEGKTLFLRQDYASARQALTHYVKLEKQSDLLDEANYMLACTTYELQMPNRIQTLSDYLEAHPESRYANRIQSFIASSYFFEGKYMEAIANFKGCDLEQLADQERDDCTLRLATSYLKINNLSEAAFWFAILKEVSATYQADATYHLAYIAYVQKKYDEALQGFRVVQEHSTYKQLAPYYIADIYLIKQKYSEALHIANLYLEAYPQGKHKEQMWRIVGEAAYGMNDYATAISSLSKYQQVAEHPERNAMYKLGMSYFHTKVYSKAASCLGMATGPKDALTQNAYLHMGLAYLQLKERNQARMAFEQASTSNSDYAIREQALYNYALCIHETSYSPFAESVTVFERFLNEYPQSAYTNKVNDYLIEVYMNTRSYLAALRSIEKISHPGTRILEAKQKLLFRLGTQAFAQASFEHAMEYFTQSLQLGQYNRQTKADAYYWRGESAYRLEQYAAAGNDLRLYLEFSTDKNSQEYGLALYNLGYTEFKQKQYNKALTWFSRCIESGKTQDLSVTADAHNRMGDCYFYNRRFDEARAQYAQASIINPALGDYSLFQEAFVKGLQRDYAGKIETLNRLLSTYPSSQYIDDALYEQGRAFVLLEDNVHAIARYTLLTERYPDSPLSRKAANEIGLLYYQNDRYAEAIAAYKKVIQTYPGSEEARLAQRDLKSIYIDLNKVDEYMAFVSALPGGANFDISERDSLTYVAAERVYMRGNMEEAKNSFTHYLQSFPQGAFSVNASYYLGLIAYNQKDYANASVYLDKVIEYPDSKFSTEAMSMCASMAYQDKAYEKALSLYKRMADRSTSQEERLQAETGALRSAAMINQPEEIIASASVLLAHSKLSPELESEARYYRAKALLNQNPNEAIQDLTILAKDTRNVYGAEAKYQVAQIYFNEGQTEKAEKEVLDYIEVSTPHAYWLARSFVLLSDVYVKLGRSLDAKQYLLSLQQNYQEADDIKQMIETRLKKLEQ